ncbi:MAG: hypothetical protein E6559_18800, partial [Pantoea sp.]|nr:hypothetical protein [Pantoea sp.]
MVTVPAAILPEPIAAIILSPPPVATRVAEYGDASGTGLLNVRTREWDRRAVSLIDDSGRLWAALPPLKSA